MCLLCACFISPRSRVCFKQYVKGPFVLQESLDSLDSCFFAGKLTRLEDVQKSSFFVWCSWGNVSWARDSRRPTLKQALPFFFFFSLVILFSPVLSESDQWNGDSLSDRPFRSSLRKPEGVGVVEWRWDGINFALEEQRWSDRTLDSSIWFPQTGRRKNVEKRINSWSNELTISLNGIGNA